MNPLMAEPKEWMKRKDYEKLGFFVVIGSDCPFSRKEVTKKIEGTFLRSRIKPIPFFEKDIFLIIEASCMTVKIGEKIIGTTMSFDIFFGENIKSLMYYVPGYVGLIQAPPNDNQYLLNSIAEGVEEALMDYIKANM